jgi:hypothetical protein
MHIAYLGGVNTLTFLVPMVRGIVSLIATIIFATNVYAQTFDFTSAQLLDKFNKQLQSDKGDVTNGCKKKGTDTICLFSDLNFKNSVREFKKLNLANGKFNLNERLLISEEKGKVSMFLLEGDRGDPMNLFHFAGQLGSLLKTINPSMSDDNIAKEALSLGVMRGDDDPTTGDPKIDILDFAEIRCNNQKSHISTKV